jgi:hypothetical protein
MRSWAALSAGVVMAVAVGCAYGQTPASAPPANPAPASQSPATQGSCTFTDETGKTVTWPNCEDPNEKKDPAKAVKTPAPANGTSPAKSFPYPGDTPPPSAPSHPGAPVSGSAPAQNGEGSAAPTNAPAAKRFPFPGEDDSAKGGTNASTTGGDTKPAPPDGLKDAGSSGSSSSSSGDDSSSSSSSSSDDSAAGPLGDDDPAARAAAARHAEKKRLAGAPKQTPDERETEDLKVAGFYQDDGDYKGAYDRAKDAVSLADDDADAHLALAEAARRLGKLDEAEQHYKKCLTLDPVPKTKRAAEKALKEMSGG